MTKIILSIKTSKGVLNYIECHSRHTNGFEWGHRLRIKQIILGELYTYYNPEMNFDNFDVLMDNRK